MRTDGMQAWLWEQYGGPEALRLGQVPKPSPAPHEVLVRVRAVSINAADWHAMRGKPAFARLTYGLVRPKPLTLGVDIAGQVESVAEDVEVGEARRRSLRQPPGTWLGWPRGIRVRPQLRRWREKPGGPPMAEAAAVPMSGVTALQGLDRLGQIEPGHKVLINGGSGGVGTYRRADRALVRP